MLDVCLLHGCDYAMKDRLAIRFRFFIAHSSNSMWTRVTNVDVLFVVAVVDVVRRTFYAVTFELTESVHTYPLMALTFAESTFVHI